MERQGQAQCHETLYQVRVSALDTTIRISKSFIVDATPFMYDQFYI
jgi:hypothetical protein